MFIYLQIDGDSNFIQFHYRLIIHQRSTKLFHIYLKIHCQDYQNNLLSIVKDPFPFNNYARFLINFMTCSLIVISPKIIDMFQMLSLTFFRNYLI
jgi:hypothetical protein